MGIYFLLIVAEVLLAACFKLNVKDRVKQEQNIAMVGMFLIFLLLALKKETVGVDIIGYLDQYEAVAEMEWGANKYYHFEKGYVQLSQLFAKNGVPFQLFLALLYAVWCHSCYLLIRDYSPNALISLLVFICYNFLVFSISGLRQTLAMAVCLYAFRCAVKYTKIMAILSVLLVLAATTIHESAVVFFAVIAVVLLMNREVKITVWLAILVAVTLLRTEVWQIVSMFYGEKITAFTLGGNFIFICGMLFLACFSYSYYRGQFKTLKTIGGKIFHVEAFHLRMFFLVLLCYIIFSGGTLLRANMYFTLFFITGIPISTSKFSMQYRFILNYALSVFLIILFYTETLAINQLELCPYLFFWQ